jgi:hypothetical protein
MENKLNTLAFGSSISKQTLNNLLETLDHIEIVWISREEYENRK